MLENFIKSIENSFLNFNIRRLFYILFVVSIIISGLIIFDSITKYSVLSKNEKKLELLEKLVTLKEKGINRYPELDSIYSSTIVELNSISKEDTFSSIKLSFIPSLFSKTIYIEEIIIISLIPCVLLFLSLLYPKVKKEIRKRNIISASIIFLLMLIFIFIMPIIYYSFINCILYIAIQIILLIAVFQIDENFNIVTKENK